MNLLIVSCTKGDMDQYRSKPLGRSLDALRDKVGFGTCIKVNNTDGMPKVYNQAVRSADPKWDSFLFVHDDVYINDWMFAEKIESAFDKFDVVGVAGASSFSAKGPRVAWHAAPQSDWSGGCFHPNVDGGGRVNEIYFTQFGGYNKACAVIDGLFIAAKRSVFDKGAWFREEFDFDFYDTSFCLEAHFKGFRIGTAPIAVTHMSHGAGLFKESYMRSQEIFKKIYSKDGK